MGTEALYQIYLEHRSVATDTRLLQPGDLFFALKGPSFDGNQFALSALEQGARLAIVDDPKLKSEKDCFWVEDALLALQHLARHHRNQFHIPVIGLTGSNGKTTTKELLNAVLSTKFRTHATKGNLNNHIGVPLTLLSMPEDAEIAIIEMGANHLGEIARLCTIADPDHGFITNIGKAHIGTFGGFENIIRGKTELYQYLIENKGRVFINSQDPVLSEMAKRFEGPIMYPGPQDFYGCQLLSANPYLQYQDEAGTVVDTLLIGGYNFSNIATALCIGKFFGVIAQNANAAIAAYVPSNNRSQILQKGSNTLILDAYNANPTSMEAAIESLDQMNAKYKVVILGDMFELDDEEIAEHKNIGQILDKKNFDLVLLCGKLMQHAQEGHPKFKQFDTREGLIEYLKTNPIENATILLKGSRGMGLEGVVEYL